MNDMRFKVIWILLFFVFTELTFAKGITRDTSCAVVLYNGAKYAMDASLGNVFVIKSYNRKIRINTEEGVKYASVAIPYYRFMEYTERVGGIKVTVGNGAVDDKGRPVERKMPRECIMDVRTDVNRWEKRFTVPDVAPGDTINIRYEISGMFPEYYERGYDSTESENFFMAFGFITKYGLGEDIVFPKWIFQENIPVMESVLEVTHFADYRFGHNLIGNEDIVFVWKNRVSAEKIDFFEIKKEVVTIIRATHKYKDSREQFEMRTHKRVIDILYPTQKTVDSLMKLELPAGVDIEIKL